MKALIFGAVAMIASPALAQPSIKSASDFMVDWKSLAGQEVSIQDCTIYGASSDLIMCYADSGSIKIDPSTLEKDALRRSMKLCRGAPVAECHAQITGIVHAGGERPTIDNVSIAWR